MTLTQWIREKRCQYFGHQWGDWYLEPAHVNAYGTIDWPMKARMCKRCGLLDVRPDFPEPVNCRCWVAYEDEAMKQA